MLAAIVLALLGAFAFASIVQGFSIILLQVPDFFWSILMGVQDAMARIVCDVWSARHILAFSWSISLGIQDAVARIVCDVWSVRHTIVLAVILYLVWEIVSIPTL